MDLERNGRCLVDLETVFDDGCRRLAKTGAWTKRAEHCTNDHPPWGTSPKAQDRGTCPACGMSLVPIPPPKIGGYAIDVTQVRDGQALAGLELAVREPGTGTLVTKFVELHEKTLHLFVVSRDLRYFAHVHPEQRPDGTFSLSHSLPAGRYMLIADFLPSGGTVQMVQKAIIVSGGRRRSVSGGRSGSTGRGRG